MTDLDAFNRVWLAARELPVRYAGESDDVRRLVDAGLLSPFPGGCALNLAFLVRKPFTKYAALDLVRLRHAARVAATLGVVGVVGWGDALAQLDGEYGESEDYGERDIVADAIVEVIPEWADPKAPDSAARALGVSPGWGPAGEYSRALREKIMDIPRTPFDADGNPLPKNVLWVDETNTARLASGPIDTVTLDTGGSDPEGMTWHRDETLTDPRMEAARVGATIKLGEAPGPATLPEGPAKFVVSDYTSDTSEAGTGYLERVRAEYDPRYLKPRPSVLDARVFKVKWHGENYYVTLSSENDRLRELFVTGPEAREWVEALARVVTAVLRTAEDPSFLFRELKRIPSAAGAAPVAALDGWRAPSIVAAIGALMEAEHARLSAPRHERAQADYAARRRNRPPPVDAANPAPAWRPEQDDGFPWGFFDEHEFIEIPKTPLLLAGYGPPPFDVTLPSGEVRRVERRR